MSNKPPSNDTDIKRVKLDASARLVQSLNNRLAKRDRRIAGMTKKVERLEAALAWRTIDLESLSKNIKNQVQEALCNVRMIPVRGLGTDDKIVKVETL